MKFHSKAIKKELSLKLRFELTHLLASSESKWTTSMYRWNRYKIEGKAGMLMVAEISDDLKEELESAVKDYFPEYEDLDMFYVLSQPGMTLENLYPDDQNFISATLFLNEDWKFWQGGHLLWGEGSFEKFEGIIPTFDALAVHEPGEKFAVMPVSTLSSEPRLTVQIHATAILRTEGD